MDLNSYQFSLVANYWWYGFISAIILIMILNIVKKHTKFPYYDEIFCNSLN
jgi:hypothetical protein